MCKNQLLLLVFCCFFDVTGAVFLLEPFYTSCGVDEFLFAGVKGMAHRADLSVDLLFCALGLERVAATAANQYFFIFRMYLLFHDQTAPKLAKAIY